MGRRANVLELSENLTQKEISDYKKKLISNIREHMKSWQTVFTLESQQLSSEDVLRMVRNLTMWKILFAKSVPSSWESGMRFPRILITRCRNYRSDRNQ